MTRGQGIIAEAKGKLAEFITFEAKMLYQKFGWTAEDDEDYEIPTGDLEPIFINVEVNNSYLDVEDRCYEQREVDAVVVSQDGEIWLGNEDGDEWTIDEISLEELAHVADVMERAYNRK